MERFLVNLLLVVFISTCKSQSIYSDEESDQQRRFKENETSEWEEDVREVTGYAFRAIFHINPHRSLKNVKPVPGCNLTRPTDEEKEALVNIHNHLRRRMAKGLEQRGYNGTSQPRARNMFALGYSDTLERMAAKWVSMCDRHFKDHFVTDDYERIWQSLVYHTTTRPEPPFDFASTVTHRFEAQVGNFYGPDAIQPFYGRNSQTNKDMRSYSIIVTQGVRSIGCAQASFYNATEEMYHRLFVCDYAGEFRSGLPLYSEGEPCANVAPFFCDNGLITVREPKET